MVERGCSFRKAYSNKEKRTIDKDNNEENKAVYKTAKKEAEKNVDITKAKVCVHLYADMDTSEGQKKVLRMEENGNIAMDLRNMKHGKFKLLDLTTNRLKCERVWKQLE